MGDRKGQISRNKVDGHVQNLKPAIPNRKRSHDKSCHWSCHLATGGTTNRLLTDIIKCGDVSGVQQPVSRIVLKLRNYLALHTCVNSMVHIVKYLRKPTQGSLTPGFTKLA